MQRSNARLSRRGLLAATGSAVFAGCSQLWTDESTSSNTDLNESELRAVATLGAPEISESLPITITSQYLNTERERARALLTGIPDSLSAADVPNEAIREEIMQAQEEAREDLQSAKQAETAFEKMGILRIARGEAAKAHGIYAAIQDELTRTQVLENRREVRAVFEQAFTHLNASITHQREQIPDGYEEEPGQYFERSLEDTPARGLLTQAFRDLERSIGLPGHLRDEGQVASGILATLTAIRDLHAFRAVREAVAAGEYTVPESVGEIREIKLDALAAIEYARTSTPYSTLTNTGLPRLATLRYADQALTEAATDEGVPFEAIQEYAWTEARAQAYSNANVRLMGVIHAMASSTNR